MWDAARDAPPTATPAPFKAEGASRKGAFSAEDLDAYRAARKRLGDVYRASMGKHFPAMALVEVKRLVDPRALVEIEATAVIPPEAV